MSNYITIDGGTTNTRISLVLNGKIKDRIALNIGVRQNAADRSGYIEGIRKSIDSLLEEYGCLPDDIQAVLCSGMITSELGLCCVSHIKVPCTAADLKNASVEKHIPDICSIPFVFIPGVKTDGDLYSADMMRGEETELFGIMNETDGECVYVLPGSHSKHIRVNSRGQITDLSTHLTGELIYAVSKDTILAESVDLSMDRFDSDYLCKGFELAKNKGITHALFKVRVLSNMFSESKENVYSFFLGAALCPEICTLSDTGADKIVIGGKRLLKLAMAELLKKYSDKNVVCICDSDVDSSPTKGIVKIFESEYI